ncbi:MAG: Fe-S cluster assembly ATPase SufC [Chloroflexi bacterium]|nr:Fe-S cluster assembly ATPase SufC [Chloroflexota bacterium]
MMGLEIKNLYVEVESIEILHGIDLRVPAGEVHAIMGPNGTGKSTLAYSLMGHPKYTVTMGDALLNGESIMGLAPEERSHKGLFLAFQYPVAIPGVTVANFLRTAINTQRKSVDPDYHGISIPEFRKLMLEKMKLLDMDPKMGGRYLNDGFSGGEKKRVEILQMAMLEPNMAVLDETDSGLDIDALRIVAQGINTLKNEKLGILVITHYQRILNYLKPDVVHVMMDGKIVESGGPDLALRLEDEGYGWVKA